MSPRTTTGRALRDKPVCRRRCNMNNPKRPNKNSVRAVLMICAVGASVAGLSFFLGGCAKGLDKTTNVPKGSNPYVGPAPEVDPLQSVAGPRSFDPSRKSAQLAQLAQLP